MCGRDFKLRHFLVERVLLGFERIDVLNKGFKSLHTTRRQGLRKLSVQHLLCRYLKRRQRRNLQRLHVNGRERPRLLRAASCLICGGVPGTAVSAAL